MRTGALLQVRLDSERLPRKALLPLRGLPVVQHVMRVLMSVTADVRALVTDTDSREHLEAIAGAEDFELFAGPKDDVLARYRLAAEHFAVDTVIRACGDEPLLSARLTDDIVRIHLTRRADLTHFVGIPLGTGVEVISRRALCYADAHASSAFEREHMTTFMYRNPRLFAIVEEPCPPELALPDIRVSLDTPSDYELLTRFYEERYRSQPFEIEEVVAWMRANVCATAQR